MKFKDLPKFLPWLRPQPETYGFEEVPVDLGEFGRIRYAKWQHPIWPIPEPCEHDVKLLRRFLSEGDVAIDVGAHGGNTPLQIGVACGPTGQVFAFEPNSFLHPILRRNSELNSDKANIVVCPYAATETDGSFEFWYSDRGYCNGGSHAGMPRLQHGHMMPLRVEGRNLHAFMSEHHAEALSKLKFIKIDTEGHDLVVAQSMVELIRRHRPYVRAEMYLRWSLAQRAAMLEFFNALDYSVRLWDGLVPDSEPIDFDKLLRWKTFDIFAVPRERTSGTP